MKYQKSMLKIYEILVRNPLKEFIIEDIIKEAKVGRTSGFDAIRRMEKSKLIKIEAIGKQKSISPIINNTAVNFKLFLDSFEFKNLESGIIFEISLFIYLASKRSAFADINAILLFGSVLSSKKPNDIDLLIVCENQQTKEEELKLPRKLTESVCGLPINMHFTEEKDIYNLIQKLSVYSKSYPTALLMETDKSLRLKLQFAEALYDIDSITNNVKDTELLTQLFYRLMLNLAYCGCWLKEKTNISKEEALKLFREAYLSKVKNFEKLKAIDKLDSLKAIANEIGKNIFA